MPYVHAKLLCIVTFLGQFYFKNSSYKYIIQVLHI